MFVSEKNFESSFINEEAFTIMKAISESTDMMLKAVRILEKKLEKMEKERKSDKAVIFKLLCDIRKQGRIRQFRKRVKEYGKKNQILKIKKQSSIADTTDLVNQIDQLVYKLYDLTEEEIKITETA